jgi:hypothetical protein
MMDMKLVVLELGENTVIFFDKDNVEAVKVLQEQFFTKAKNNVVFVNLDPLDDIYLYSDRFLVENHQYSLRNHLLWKGLFDDSEQYKYLLEKAKYFLETGSQLLIEEYEFSADEPFYDYSK